MSCQRRQVHCPEVSGQAKGPVAKDPSRCRHVLARQRVDTLPVLPSHNRRFDLSTSMWQRRAYSYFDSGNVQVVQTSAVNFTSPGLVARLSRCGSGARASFRSKQSRALVLTAGWRHCRGGILADDMGLGKTAASLNAVLDCR